MQEKTDLFASSFDLICSNNVEVLSGWQHAIYYKQLMFHSTQTFFPHEKILTFSRTINNFL